MGLTQDTLFESFLHQHDREAWERAIQAIRPDIHEVDRDATTIWFHFFPLDLACALGDAEDPAELARKLLIQGNHELKNQIDDSHRFFYGHRYWSQVKSVVLDYVSSSTAPRSLDLGAVVRSVAREVGARAATAEPLLLGISAVGLMTLQQVGAERFRATPGSVALPRELLGKSPDEIVRQRARDDSQGLMGFLRGIKTQYTVTFDEGDPAARFQLINAQHLTTAAAADHRDHRSRDPRCQEGPIPVQCRTASCGTCWVGVLGGAAKLSDVDELERRRIREFGYIETDEAKPVIRLSCMAQASGNVTIVIPPWNGYFGKFLRQQAVTSTV